MGIDYTELQCEEDRTELKMINFQNDYMNALEFFQTHSGQIEIKLNNKQLEKVMFPIMPFYFFKNQSTNPIKQKFWNRIDRET